MGWGGTSSSSSPWNRVWMPGLHLQWVLTMLTAVTLAAVALILATWFHETVWCGGWVYSDACEMQCCFIATKLLTRSLILSKISLINRRWWSSPYNFQFIKDFSGAQTDTQNVPERYGCAGPAFTGCIFHPRWEEKLRSLRRARWIQLSLEPRMVWNDFRIKSLGWQDQKRWAAIVWPELNDVKCQCAGCWLVQFSDQNAVLNYCSFLDVLHTGKGRDFGRFWPM